MAFKSILVHQSEDPRAIARRELALELARVHEAHLTALYVEPATQIPSYVRVDIPDEALEEQRQRARARAEEAKAEFRAAGERAGVSVEWRGIEGSATEKAESRARYCDLAVVGQTDPEQAVGSAYDVAEELVMAAGRPVLTIPFAGTFERVGARVLVAWDGTREASRAVHDALPLLVRAKQVIVYRVNPPGGPHIAGADLATHLARHGVEAEAHHTVSKLPSAETAVIGARSLSIADLLLSAASDFGVDLMVMGAYGHSRLRELVLGGTTRYIFQHMTVPVLMSH